MATPRFRRRPNRRQTTPALIERSPLGLQFQTPGTGGGFTTFVLPLTQFAARVDADSSGPDVEAIQCTGYFDDVWSVQNCSIIGNDGEDGGGTLVRLVFPGELDTTQPWQLSIPASTPLIQSRFGGRLAGTYDLGEAVGATPYGRVKMTNLSDGPFVSPQPPKMVLRNSEITTASVIRCETKQNVGSFTFGDLTKLVVAGFNYTPDSAVSIDTNNFDLTFSEVMIPGTRLELSLADFAGIVTGAGGQQLLPFSSYIEP